MGKEKSMNLEVDNLPTVRMVDLWNHQLLDPGESKSACILGFESEVNIVSLCENAKFQEKIDVKAIFVDAFDYEGKSTCLRSPVSGVDLEKSNRRMNLPLNLEFLYKTDFGENDGVWTYYLLVRNMEGIPEDFNNSQKNTKAIMEIWVWGKNKIQIRVKTRDNHDYPEQSRTQINEYIYNGILPKYPENFKCTVEFCERFENNGKL